MNKLFVFLTDGRVIPAAHVSFPGRGDYAVIVELDSKTSHRIEMPVVEEIKSELDLTTVSIYQKD